MKSKEEINLFPLTKLVKSTLLKRKINNQYEINIVIIKRQANKGRDNRFESIRLKSYKLFFIIYQSVYWIAFEP